MSNDKESAGWTRGEVLMAAQGQGMNSATSPRYYGGGGVGQNAVLSPGAGSPGPLADAERLLKADAEHRSLAADQILMLTMVGPFAQQVFTQLSEGLFKWNRHQGFWPKGWEQHWGVEFYKASPAGDSRDPVDPDYVRMKKAEKIALIHSELSEMLEAVRNGDRGNEAEELADAVIRILDYAGGFGIPLWNAIRDKQIKNYARPFKHGKGF